MYDVAVLGGGNAALCAALAAAERGARVVIIERAPRPFRGGNSRHVRNLRCMHTAPTDVLTDEYGEDEFMADLLRVTGGITNETLARMMIRASAGAPERMRRSGVRFQRSLRGTLQLGRTNAFFLGGGKALINSFYAAACRRGIEIMYEADVVALRIANGRFESVTVRTAGGDVEIGARAAVLAAGGFESNLEWLRDVWGDAANNFIIRGTPYNTGTVLRLMLDAGAEPVGDPAQCHAVAIDARAPKFDGGIVTRLDSVPLGIVVNKHGDRFYDEGEDFWPKRYAIWGRLVGVSAHRRPIDSRARAAHRRAARNTGLHGGAFQHRRAAGHVRSSVARRLPYRGARAEQDALGAAARHATVLGVSAAAGHHVHLSRGEGGRARARDHEGRRREQPLRRGRDHGRQHSGPWVHRGRRHDDWDGLRRDRRYGGILPAWLR
jgi:succinate dehydrogenase/fumarate reductase flavoprotein subunit